MLLRLRHLWQALTAVPGLLFSRRKRALYGEMRSLSRRLPALMEKPLPQAMQHLSRDGASAALAEDEVRRLADLVALLDRRSPLGFCMRRSLLRYHFLRRAGLPLRLHFGARLKTDRQERAIGGHAWVTHAGRPYHEADEHWRDYVIMVSWPQDE